MDAAVVLAVMVLIGLALLGFMGWLPGADYGHVVRDSRWKREERAWETDGGPPEVVRTYRGPREMKRDRDRLAELGYRMQDEQWHIDEQPDSEDMPSRDSMVLNSLRAQSGRASRGPEIVVTYVKDAGTGR